MKRTLLIALGALLVLVLAAGCANTPDASESPSQSAQASDAAEKSASASAGEASGDASGTAELNTTATLEGLSYKVDGSWESKESSADTTGEDVKTVMYTLPGQTEDGLIVSAIQIEPELWDQINAVSLQPGVDTYQALIDSWSQAFGGDAVKELDPLPSGVHAGWQAQVSADGKTTCSVMVVGEDGLEYSLTATDTDNGPFAAIWDDLVASLSVA